MRVHSFVPLLGLSLATVAVAQDSNTTYYHGAIFTNTSTTSKRAALPLTPARQAFGKRDPTIFTGLPTKWSYLGCYTDDPSSRTLIGDSYCDDTGLCEETCIEYCDAHGFSLAGVEFGQECYCGYSLGPSSTKAPELDCNMECSGNADELCGAAGRINVFTNGDPAPTVLPTAGDFTSLGCYSDSASARTLTTSMSLTGNVRVTDCTSACENAGFSYAGLEFGDECYCGSSIENGGAPIADSSCNLACTADHTELCGGAAAINIYQNSAAPAQTAGTLPSGWSALSCYTDSVSARTLANQISLDSTTVTTESCISACQSAGYSIAGTEYSDECYCGNTIDNGATATTSGCDMACSGNHAETCGGAAHINLYQFSTGTCNLPGCYDGSGLLSEINTSLSGCLAACNADSSCVDIQYSHNPTQVGICNLFYVPRSSNYYVYSSSDPYCLTYSFYDKTCSA